MTTQTRPMHQAGDSPIQVELPAELAGLIARAGDDLSARVKEIVLVELFRQERISSGKAAGVLGVSKSDFIDLLARYRIPYLDASEEELRQQVEAARPRRSVPAGRTGS